MESTEGDEGLFAEFAAELAPAVFVEEVPVNLACL